MKNIAALFVITLVPLVSLAQQIAPLAGAAIEFGGDKIVDVVYTDGSSSTIEAGRGLLLFGGAALTAIELEQGAIEVQTTLGIKWTSTKQATNGSFDFYRFPLEALVLFRNDFLRLGGGVTYQFGNKLKGSDAASPYSVDLKSALGVIVQGDYVFGDMRNNAVGLRYTVIDYVAKGMTTEVNGASFGLDYTYFFR